MLSPSQIYARQAPSQHIFSTFGLRFLTLRELSGLGHLHLNGDGIEKNIAEGYFWLLLSVSTYNLKSTKQERAKMNVERRELQLIAKGLTEEERKGHWCPGKVSETDRNV